ncbi:MAG: hypothetical protein KDB22_12410 [Planctomycetales bacterium]|nr:hypothetical protein [Planctomycetales bacterium]
MLIRNAVLSLCFLQCCIPLIAQEDLAAPLELQSAVRVYQGRVRANAMIYVSGRVHNHGQQVQNARLVATVSGSFDQSVSNFQIGPNQTEFVPVQICLPSNLPAEGTVEIEISLVQPNDEQIILQFRGQPQQQTLSMTAGRIASLAGMALEPELRGQPAWYWPPLPPYASYELALASRIDAGYSRDALFMDAAPPPLDSTTWQDLDSVVISDPRFFDDLASVEMSKRYLSKGGRVWVMLDNVPCECVRPLLGIEQACEEVDTVELTQCVIQSTDSTRLLSEQDRTIQQYDPIALKRVVQSGGEVTHTVDGWPAAIWMKVGLGDLLLTTLDRRAWIEPRATPTKNPMDNVPYATKPWAAQLATRAHANIQSGIDDEPSEYPVQLIGNAILSRSVVMTALLCFCAVFVVSAAVLHFGSWNKLWLFAVSPIVAIAFAGFLLFAASTVRQGISEGVAILQRVSVTEDGTTAIVQEECATYLNSTNDMGLELDGDGMATISPQVTAGVKRFVQDDFQHWRISNPAWPPGTWRYQSEYAVPTTSLIAQAKFTEQGVEFELPELPSLLSDPIVEYIVGDPMICLEREGKLVCDGQLAARDDRLIVGQLLSSEQQRRTQVYQRDLTRVRGDRVRGQQLYGWTGLWAGNPQWTASLPQTGSALVALPISILRPRDGETITIPHGFIRLQNRPNQLGTTSAFHESIGSWSEEMTMGIRAEMQFLLPPELLPFAATSIDLELNVQAPRRKVRLLAGAGPNGPVPVFELSSPSIGLKQTITDSDVLADFADGVLDCIVEITDRTDISQPGEMSGVVSWKIEHFRATVQGTVTTPTRAADVRSSDQ